MIGSAAPSSNDMLSGSTCTVRASATASSANAPVLPEASTRSPTRIPDTCSPTARTTPASSAPGVNGNFGFTW